MSISSEITRIQDDRNTIRNKLVNFGIVESNADLDDLATAIDGMDNVGAIQAQIVEGETYTVPRGFHNGSGTVTGIAGGGNYSLQAKTITPTKSQQSVTPDNGYYGLSGVTVEIIPQNYQDISNTTAVATDVLVTKVFIASDGTTTTGTMANNGVTSLTIDGLVSTSASIPAGYTSGGTVSLTSDIETALAAI